MILPTNVRYRRPRSIATKVDARSITTSYTYDRLNRVTQRSYAMPSPTPSPSQYQNSPTVNYYYDNITNGKGKLKKVTSSVSTTEYTSFDILGRVTASKQTTDGVEYGGSGSPAAMTYTYNLGGAMVEQQYPSGRVVKNTLDASGDLSMIASKENSSAIFKTYVNDFTYNAAGAVTSLKLGNGKFESTQFNSRLQPIQIALGASVGDTSSLKLDYSYGDWNGSSIDATKNNGNIVQQVITTPTVGSSTGFTATQKYYYDSLNRIDDSTETISSTQTWRQDFTYDRYGNRRFNETNTSMPASFSNQALTNPTISASNNRLTSTGWTYDASGNTTGDSQSRTFIYDGENKQVEVKNSSSATIGQYTYDGDGRRVKKYVPGTGETTIFVYDAAGKQIAEYSTIVADASTAKVAYLTADHLGSPRINTDVIGAVTSRHDYHPFGEEITAAQRTSGVGYAGDTVRKQFTGYERDNESSLDFAQARMYGYNHGRFTSPDPFGPWAMSEDEKAAFYLVPQQWNRYAYVLNNPVRLTDPTGLEVYDGTVSEEQQAIIRKALQNIAKNGNQEQRAVANWILKNDILISLVDRSSTVDGTAGLQSGNGEALSQRLEKGYISKEEAASYLQIKLNEGRVGDSDFAQAVLEGVINHEGRHAWVDALAIQSVSSDCGQRCYYSISNFTDEQKAFQTEATYLLNRANAGNAAAREAGLGGRGRFNLLSEENGRLQVNEGKIRQILSQTYGLDENRQGRTTIQSLQNSGVRIPTRPRR